MTDRTIRPIDSSALNGDPHGSRAIDLVQIVWAHGPAPTEIMAFVGLPGDDFT